MIDTMNVGKSIAFLRKQKQMTQQGLAAAVNVSHQAVSKWEKGAALPDMQTMLTLSRLFGVSMEDLLTGALVEAAESAEAENAAVSGGIELKLDSGDLNMNIVAEADDVIARAMEGIEAEPAAEPAAEENAAQEAEADATVNVGMTFDEIIRMAPFVGSAALQAMLRSCEGDCEMADLIAIAPYAGKELERMVVRCRMDWDALRRLAPFLSRDALRNVVLANVQDVTMERLRRLAPFFSRDALAEILAKMPQIEDVTELKRLAPFLSRDALYAQLKRFGNRLTVDDLLPFAPFLSKDGLGDLVAECGEELTRDQMIRLAKYLPRDQMDRLVYRAMGMKPPVRKSFEWDVTAEFGRAYHEIKDAVHSGMQEARDAIKMAGLGEVMEGLNGAMKDVGGRINEAINSAWNASAKDASGETRAQRIRARIAEKALAEGNWDWICAHVDELTPDQLKQVLMKCAAAGHEELIEQHLERVSLTSAEACRLAQTVIDEDIWEKLLEMMETDHAQRVLDYIGRTNSALLERFDRYAQKEPDLQQMLAKVRAGEGECVSSLPAEAQLALVQLALAADDVDMEDVIPHLQADILPQVLGMLLDVQRAEDAILIAQHANAEDLPAMALMLVERGLWAMLDDMLSGIADVDLRRVWPLVINQSGMADVIALHGDDATLRDMALAMAAQARFDEMDSFLEELEDDTLEAVLEKAMEKSDWDAIERISTLLGD